MDHASKRAQVEKIDDEVNELHPLLESIFKEMPHLQHVEYTHGANEKGADFVIERRDEVLKTTDYIGVVAKTGKIFQSMGDVERQIDECSLPRKIKNGRQTVRLPEVWVVTSKSVTNNAKDKIADKFSSKKIHFFDADWLVQKIDEHAPYFWEHVDGVLGKYLATLDKRLGIISAQTAVITADEASSIHIDVDVEEIEIDRYGKTARRSKQRLVNLHEEVINHKVCVVEGEMGYGKSHLARRLAARFADIHAYKQSSVLPIFAGFKTYADANLPLADFVAAQIGAECFKAARESNSRILLIFDGLDEALANQEDCKKKMAELIAAVKSEPFWHLMLTSRPWRSLDEFAPAEEGVRRFRIRPLSIAKIVNYLREVLRALQLPNRLVDDLANSSLFRQLPHNPIAAALLANIVKQEQQELPSTLTELYAKTVELMLGRWDERRQIATEKQYKANERLARLLAKHMIDNQLVYMSKGEVRDMFKAFLAERQTGISLDETFDYLVNRSTLFGVFEDTDAVFFKHRSFAEYLYARDAYEMRNLEVSERAFDPYWLNIYFFYLGARSECPDLVDALIAAEPKKASQRVYRFLNMANYMLAAYETPYVHVQRATSTLLVEAARLYIDIRNGNMPTGLQGLTEMQLLWYLTQAVRQCYGYEFFESALEYAMAQIDEELPPEDEARPYALFFAACSLADIEDTCGFAYLVENYSPTVLPLPISLALKSEMSFGVKEFAHSKPVKEFERKLRKTLHVKNDERLGQDSRLKLLFHAPLSSTHGKQRALPADGAKGASSRSKQNQQMNTRVKTYAAK